MFTLNRIDYLDTTGRANFGTAALIGKLSITSLTSTEDWLRQKTAGTDMCSFVGADYSSDFNRIVAVFITDDALEPFYI